MPNIENRGPFIRRGRPNIQNMRAGSHSGRVPKERIIFNATRNIVTIKEQLMELRNAIDETLNQLELLSSSKPPLNEEEVDV